MQGAAAAAFERRGARAGGGSWVEKRYCCSVTKYCVDGGGLPPLPASAATSAFSALACLATSLFLHRYVREAACRRRQHARQRREKAAVPFPSLSRGGGGIEFLLRRRFLLATQYQAPLTTTAATCVDGAYRFFAARRVGSCCRPRALELRTRMCHVLGLLLRLWRPSPALSRAASSRFASYPASATIASHVLRRRRRVRSAALPPPTQSPPTPTRPRALSRAQT